jgi:hypothetical protein
MTRRALSIRPYAQAIATNPNGIEVDGIGPMANRSMHIADAGGQGLTIAHFSAQPKPFWSVSRIILCQVCDKL